MTTNAELRVHRAQSPYGDLAKAAIDENVVPYERAEVGDLVAIQCTLVSRAGSHYARGNGVCIFYFKTKDGLEWKMYSKIAREDHPRLKDFAHLAMTCIADTEHENATEEAVQDLNPDNGEDHYAQAILMPDAILVTQSDTDEYLEELMEDGVFNPDVAPDLIRLVIRKGNSAHQEVDIRSKIRGVPAFAAAVTEMYDSEGAKVQFVLNHG